jgi:hypothetical protein
MSGDRSVSPGLWDGDQMGFGSALIAVLVAGFLAGIASTLIARSSFSHETRLLVTLFVGVLVGSVALLVFLWISDWTLSPVVAVVVMVLASGVPLIAGRAVTRAEAHAVGNAPSALPVIGIGVNAIGAVIGLALLFGEALLVQQLARRAPDGGATAGWDDEGGSGRGAYVAGVIAIVGVCAVVALAGYTYWHRTHPARSAALVPLNGYAPTVAVQRGGVDPI